jgi:hypothetical protein
MRPTGGSHRGALSPADKPRDAEAMDVGVAAAVDERLGRHRADAGTKPKPLPVEPKGVEKTRRRG